MFRRPAAWKSIPPGAGHLSGFLRLHGHFGYVDGPLKTIFSDVSGETVPRFDKAGRGGFMRRFFTLVCLLCLAIPAGISISGCTRNPAANYCNGLGYGLKITEVASIDLEPRTTGISLAFGQTRQIPSPSAKTCKGATASVAAYTYGTTNNQLVDISPSGNMCAGTWNHNSGGGIADYTICNFPKPLPNSGGLPYAGVFITASASTVTSNPLEVYVHAPVTSVSLVGPQQCLSQGVLAQLDAQACYSTTNAAGQPVNSLLCKPPTVTDATQFACPLPTVNGVQVPASSIPSCSTAIGALTYNVGTASVASINSVTNQITAEQPGTTVITASVAGSGSSAGYFSTCPPESISVTLANGSTVGTITKGATQNLVTTVKDTNGVTITGLTLDYQSTDPVDISVGAAGAVSTAFPGVASVNAICQPATCNPSPINEVGLYGTGLAISSNPVTITTPGTASDYVWFSAPGQSQYVIPVELISGTVGSTVRLPYVPNSMVVDRLGTNLYLGSSHGVMVYSTASNSITKQDPNVPGVVLAVSPNNQTLLINDPIRQTFYLYTVSSGAFTTFGGMGHAASWTPDSKTLYVTDSAALNRLPENVAAGITAHTDKLYVNNVNTGWTSYPLPCSVFNATTCPNPSTGAQSLAITIPSVGAYLSGSFTVSHTWCPKGTVGDYASMSFYPQADVVNAQTDVLAATTDGQHILGAAVSPAGITLSDIGVSIPATGCTVTSSGTPPVQTLSPLSTGGTLAASINVNSVSATKVNQVVPSPASNLAFITYTGSSTGALLPYYIPGSPAAGYVTLTGSSAITAPLVGAFSPDDKIFFVSTAGDNLIHYINVQTLTDTQQIAPNLPACTPDIAGGGDAGCLLAAPTTNPVPATAIAVKPRSTT